MSKLAHAQRIQEYGLCMFSVIIIYYSRYIVSSMPWKSMLIFTTYSLKKTLKMCNTKFNAKKYKQKWEESNFANILCREMLLRPRSKCSLTHAKPLQESKYFSSWVSDRFLIHGLSTTARIRASLSGLNCFSINPP